MRVDIPSTVAVHHHGLLHSDLPEVSDRSFLEAYDCLMQDDQERLYAMTVTRAELNILKTDDQGLSLVHWSVKHDKLAMCKFIMDCCCRSDKIKESLRNTKVLFRAFSTHEQSPVKLLNFRTNLERRLSITRL